MMMNHFDILLIQKMTKMVDIEMMKEKDRIR